MSTFVHMELSTGDIEAAKQFYEGLFGWRFEDVEMPTGPYAMVRSADGVGIGGIQQNPMPETPNHWLGYVAVDSVARAISTTEELGGTVVVPALEVGGMGTMAICTDPQGAVFAVWEAAAPAPAETGGGTVERKKTSKKSAAKKGGKKGAKKGAAKSSERDEDEDEDEDEAPALEKPAAKKPVAKNPAAKKPAAKKPAAKKSAAKKPAAKKPAAKKPAAKKPPAKQPTPKKPAAKPAKKQAKKPAKRK